MAFDITALLTFTRVHLRLFFTERFCMSLLRESCVFQVQVMKLSDAEEIEKRIRHLLEQPYNSSSLAVATHDIEISRICKRIVTLVKLRK